MSGMNSDGLPKGHMRQPEVRVTAQPDQPNAPRHAELRKTWAPGQRWETLVPGCTQWVPVSNSGYAEPTWDAHQDYRPMEAQ